MKSQLSLRNLISIALVVLVSGCATPGDPEPNAAASAGKVTCAREVPTGSHRSTVVCRTEAEKKADKEDLRKARDLPRMRNF